MFPQCSDLYRALIYDQGGSGRDLIQRAVRDLKVFGESLAHNVRHGFVGLVKNSVMAPLNDGGAIFFLRLNVL